MGVSANDNVVISSQRVNRTLSIIIRAKESFQYTFKFEIYEAGARSEKFNRGKKLKHARP